ncbi:MAG: hypothetical protein WBP79_07650 [Candidatus Acidiferrales bacterium]
MKLFRGKDSGAAPRDNGPAEGERNPAAVTHRLTQDLARVEGLAMMLAKSRAASAVEVADLLAGMYIYEWDRLAKYWEDEEQVEAFLQQICQISPQRWHHWIEIYNQKRQSEETKRARRFFRSSKKEAKQDGKPLARSMELQSILKKAEQVAPHHDQFEGRTIPILTCECVLLCIAKNTESEIGHRLVASGLDVPALERDARFPRHGPLH